MEKFRPYHQPLLAAGQEIFAHVERTLPPLSPLGLWAWEVLKEYSAHPGKQLRGALAAAIYDSETGNNLGAVGLRLGASIEIMQNYLLIIDDVIDQSAMRRSMATLHERYLLEVKGSSRREAEMAAVILGTLAQHVATLGMTSAKSLHALEALSAMQRNTMMTGFGQLDDSWQRIDQPVTRIEIMRRYEQKTSYYSFVEPVEAAMILAHGASESTRQNAEAYGLPTGVIFQLRDDYLGSFGNPEKTGKSNLDDLREGKLTLQIYMTLERATPAEKATIMRVLGKTDATKADAETVCQVAQEHHVLADIMKEMKQQLARAKKAAQAGEWNSSTAALLIDMAKFAMERQR